MFPPRVGGFEPPYIQLLLSYFIFLDGGGSIHGVQHSPKCTAKVRKIIELAKFRRYFFAVFRLFHTHTSHSTIDNRTHSFGGRNATSVEREARSHGDGSRDHFSSESFGSLIVANEIITRTVPVISQQKIITYTEAVPFVLL